MKCDKIYHLIEIIFVIRFLNENTCVLFINIKYGMLLWCFLQLKKYDKIYESLYFLYKFCPFIEAPLNKKIVSPIWAILRNRLTDIKGGGVVSADVPLF